MATNLQRCFQSGKFLVCRVLLLLAISVPPQSCSTDRSERSPGSELVRIESEQDLHRAREILITDSMNAGIYCEIWNYQTREKAYDEMMSEAAEVFERGIREKNPTVSAYAAAYLTQTCLLQEKPRETELWLDRSFELLKKLPAEDFYLVRMVNNLAGIHTIVTKADYSAALGYFKTALAATEQTGDSASEGALLRNITHIYEIREDVSGLDYALRSYKLAAETGDINARSLASLALSSMYILKNDCRQALRYAQESIEHIDDSDYAPANKSYALYNYGNVCIALGDEKKAKSFFEMALKHLDSTDTTVKIRTFASYANLYLKQQNYKEAIGMFLKAERLFNHSNMECQATVLSGLSRAYDASGNTLKALEYYKKYFDVRTRTMNFRQENAFRDLLMKYADSEHRRELERKETELLKKDKKMMAAIFGIAIIGVIFVFFGLLYWRKNAMYRKLVLQNLDYQKSLNEYKRCEELKKTQKQQAHLKIYEELEHLMRDEKLYRRSDLTIQMLAELLGTNTTYMSDVINRFSGKSFPTYLNGYRLEEVLSVLSDPKDDSPIYVIFENAGYTSRTTYTRIFREKFGCTPSRYREVVRELRTE